MPSRDKGRQVPDAGQLVSIPGATHRWHQKKGLSPLHGDPSLDRGHSPRRPGVSPEVKEWSACRQMSRPGDEAVYRVFQDSRGFFLECDPLHSWPVPWGKRAIPLLGCPSFSPLSLLAATVQGALGGTFPRAPTHPSVLSSW